MHLDRLWDIRCEEFLKHLVAASDVGAGILFKSWSKKPAESCLYSLHLCRRRACPASQQTHTPQIQRRGSGVTPLPKTHSRTQTQHFRLGTTHGHCSGVCLKWEVVCSLHRNGRQGKGRIGPQSALCEGGGPLLPLTWATVTGPPPPVFVLIEVHLCPRQCLSSSFWPQQEAVRVAGVVTQLPIQVVVTTTMGPQVPQ